MRILSLKNAIRFIQSFFSSIAFFNAFKSFSSALIVLLKSYAKENARIFRAEGALVQSI